MAPIDRMAELRRMREENKVEEEEEEEEDEEGEAAGDAGDHEDDEEEEEDEEDEEEDPLFGFKDRVGDLKDKMREIKKCTMQIEEIAETQQGNVEPIVKTANPLAGQVRAGLQKLKRENEELQQKANVDGGSALKIRQNFHRNLTREFFETLHDYNGAQRKHKERFVSKVTRQALIVNPDITEGEVESMIENGKTENMFAESVLDAGKMDAADALQSMQEQYHDLVELQKSIIELHQMFVEVAVLIEAQGEMMDQIEYNVSNSVGYTGEALKAIAKKERNVQRKRKAMACCACCAGTAAAGACTVCAAKGAFALAPLLAICSVM
eukprot:TRINITY_DN1532_c0_g1_i3.p1 TRINITY_DN1532_c0_g1~~TRINITY_DN1532_c0_g1_i3.p1  ORF type:complete len:324 (-),score=108.11 TRINITY_DN1532_c0_g1_i3:216-1187(-)